MSDELDFPAGKPGPVKRPPADNDRIVDLPSALLES
jgi:hypothetical protein